MNSAMKALLVLVCAAALVIALAIIISLPAGTVNASPEPGVDGTGSGTKTTVAGTPEETMGGDTMAKKSNVRIKMTFDNGEVMVKMQDNPTSRDFLALLPMTLTFEDYAGAEKIGRLPKRLSTKEAPAGSDPSVGDFAYFSPWGNLAIYYRDAGYYEGIIILGTIESGTERLGSMNSDFIVHLERVD